MRRHWSLVLARLAIVLVALTTAARAHADTRFPVASAIVADPHDPKVLYARTTFGLLTSRDGGDSWHWICAKAIGVADREDPTYVVTPKGTLVAATRAGLAVSRDQGCSFTVNTAQVLADVALRPPGDLVGVSAGAGKVALVTSTDDASSFSAEGGTLDKTLALETIRLGESERGRIYVTAKRGEAPVLVVSIDGGMSWIERKVELGAGETSIALAGVDPKKADRVWLRTSGDGGGRLLVSEDGGKTWKKAFESSGPLLGVALSEDGSQVVASSRDGVSLGKADPLAFRKGSATEAHCLAYVPGGMVAETRVWACATERSGFFLGSSKNGGASFEPKLKLEEIKGPLACPAESTVAQACTDGEWKKARRELNLPDADEKPRNQNAGGPALKGRATRTASARSPFRTAAGIALVGIAAYFILQRLMRGRKT